MKVTLRNVAYDFYNKENKKTNEKVDILKSSLEKLKKTLEGTNFSSEEEKIEYERKLNDRIKMGVKLSNSEMNYLLKTNPMMYMRIKRVQMNREALERKLKQCESKKEVEQAYHEATSTIHPKDPDKQLLVSAYGNVTREFKKTREYQTLPLDAKARRNGQIARRRERQKKSFHIYGMGITIDKSV